MLKALLRLRVAAWLNWLSGGSRTRKKPSKVKPLLFGLLMIYVLGCFAMMFFALFSVVSEPWYEAGLSWLYFAFFVLVDFAVMFVFSVFTAKAQLFEAKDNDLLLSLPIPPAKILLSRMLGLLGVNFLLDLLVALPVLAAWLLNCPLSGAGALAFAVAFLLTPLFSLALSSFFGWLLSLATARMRRKSLFSTLFSLLFLGLYFYFFSQFGSLMYQLAAVGELLAGKLQAVTPLYWLGHAIADGDLSRLLPGALTLLLPFVLAWWLLSRSFIHTVTNVRGQAKLEYKEKALRLSSPRAALFKRELSRFLSSSTYIMNAALGPILLLVAALALPFFAERINQALAMAAQIRPLLTPLAVLALCAVAGMTNISSASIAMEGDTLWLAQSLPVDTIEVFRAKLRLHLTMALPPVLLMVLSLSWLLRPSLPEVAAALLLCAAYAVCTDLLGLRLNLKHPNLEAMNETQAVKSSIAVMLSLLLNWALTVTLAAAGYGLSLLWDWWLVLLALAAVLLAVCWGLWRWLKRRGTVIFRSL